jgi:hypothetical protein
MGESVNIYEEKPVIAAQAGIQRSRRVPGRGLNENET